MEIVFHLGAHATDNGLLLRSLLRNREVLAAQGIGVPGPSRYRETIGQVSTELRGAAADAETEDLLIDAIQDDDTALRIILSNENFLCRDVVALDENGLYPRIGKAAWLASCFPSHQVEFAIALRNPATFVPEMARRGDLAAEDAPRHGAMWSEAILRLLDACPGARLLAWCDEDAPFLWPEIMREIAGIDATIPLKGAFDMVNRIMTPDGRARMRDFTDNRPDLTEAQRRRAVAAFLEAHAEEEAITQEIDMAGWTDETVTWLTQDYEEDVERIASMPGITFLEP